MTPTISREELQQKIERGDRFTLVDVLYHVVCHHHVERGGFEGERTHWRDAQLGRWDLLQSELNRRLTDVHGHVIKEILA